MFKNTMKSLFCDRCGAQYQGGSFATDEDAVVESPWVTIKQVYRDSSGPDIVTEWHWCGNCFANAKLKPAK